MGTKEAGVPENWDAGGWGQWPLGASDWRCSRLGMPETGDADIRGAGNGERCKAGTLQTGIAGTWGCWNLVKREIRNRWAEISEKGDNGRWVLEKKDAGNSDQ